MQVPSGPYCVRPARRPASTPIARMFPLLRCRVLAYMLLSRPRQKFTSECRVYGRSITCYTLPTLREHWLISCLGKDMAPRRLDLWAHTQFHQHNKLLTLHRKI